MGVAFYIILGVVFIFYAFLLRKMKSMEIKKRIILCGKAGSGKDYFRDFLKKEGYTISISKTTRAPREGEIQGVTYDYISEKRFMTLLEGGKFHEHVIFNGKGYGTTISSFNNDEVFIFTPEGIDNLTRKEKNESIIVYFDIDLSTRVARMEKRMNAGSIEARLQADGIEFMDFRDFNIRVTNPEFHLKKLLSTIKAYDEV